MSELSRAYGAPGHASAEPVVQWLNTFWGWPVRLHVIDRHDDYWLRGVLTSVGVTAECLFTARTLVEIKIRDDDQELSVSLDTTDGGSLIWDSPMRRALRVIGNTDQSYVIYDDRPIRQIDLLEDQLEAALAEEDPMLRHDLLAALAEVVTTGSEDEPDDTLRARLVGLSVFLEGYRDPRSAGGDGT